MKVRMMFCGLKDGVEVTNWSTNREVVHKKLRGMMRNLRHRGHRWQIRSKPFIEPEKT